MIRQLQQEVWAVKVQATEESRKADELRRLHEQSTRQLRVIREQMNEQIKTIREQPAKELEQLREEMKQVKEDTKQALVVSVERTEAKLSLFPWDVDVQTQTDRLMDVVLDTINSLAPRAKPSPYAKRWWTTDLTKLRRAYTFWRNLARAWRRAGQRIDSLEGRAKEAGKEYHDAIKRHKRAHWDDFLADGTNIWQAAKYLKPRHETNGRTGGGTSQRLLPTATSRNRRRRFATAAQRSGHAEADDGGGGEKGDGGQGMEGTWSRRTAGDVIKPKQKAKILGVIIDARLRFKKHMAEAATRDLTAAMCLRRLKMSSPRTARQLFTATVAPAIDYALVVWSHARSERALSWFNRGQKMGARAITSAFRTVATAVVEAEAGIQTVLMQVCGPLKVSTSRRYMSPLKKLTLAHEGSGMERMETIEAYAVPPWHNHVSLLCEADREAATTAAKNASDIVIATSASDKGGLVGMGGIVAQRSPRQTDKIAARYSVTLVSRDDQNPYTTKLEAIAMALRCMPDRPCTSVDGNSDEGTLDPASETVSRLENKRQLQSHDISRLNQLVPRLKEDQQLQSDDIWLIMKYLIPYSDDWHVFDPGYPMDKSPPRRRLVSANNIICILNESGHWSLCRLNKADGHFDHYNSLVRINKPTA
ncbi:hypothetical protein FOMA001_g18803 [Fusarium oxysporum f. sp. matthiolae]|nr:hypothetical protein FOMA001_g18803 [Fusarium oxysporum f. sp. matthiolae]